MNDLTTEISKRFKFDDVKNLTLFVDRFIPQRLREKYPKYKAFIKHFLEYLDSGYAEQEGIFQLISELIKYFDLDYINEELVERDENGDVITEDGKRIFNELGENLIYSFYQTFTSGGEQTRYLTTLLDDVTYLKNNKRINRTKGTKNSFLFFFLIVLGGFFQILNVSESKIHNGVWAYDGSLTYNDPNSEILDPYRYIVFSEFNPSRFKRIVDALNPAGMEPIYFIQKQIFLDLTQTGYNDSVDYYFENDNVYIALYNNDTFIGMVKTFTSTGYDLIGDQTTDNYDLATTDGRKWDYLISAFQYRLLDDSTGSNEKEIYRNDIEMMFYGAILTENEISGTFNKVTLIQVNDLVITQTGISEESNIFTPDTIDIDATGTDINTLIEYDFSEDVQISDINEIDFVLER